MTTTRHTPIPTSPKSAANAATFNAPLSQLDAAIVAEEAARAAETARAMAQEQVLLSSVGSGAGWASTLDAEAASGQKVCPVVSTTGAVAGMPVYLGLTSGTHEVGVIDTISAGVSVTLVTNLTNTYAAGTPTSATPAEVADARGGYATLDARLTTDRTEQLSTVAAAGSTETIDLANGSTHDVTLTADCTFTFTGAPAGVTSSFTLILRQDGTGGWTATWPGSVVWPGGVAPWLSRAISAVSILTFFTLDGGTIWFGFASGGTSFHGAKAYQNGTQTVLTTASAALVMTSFEFDTDGFRVPAGDTTRFTCPAGLGGRYLLTGYAWGASGLTTVPSPIYLRKGGDAIRGGGANLTSTKTDGTVSAVVTLAAGEYVDCAFWNATAGSVVIGHASSTSVVTTFSIVYLGP